jgi:organic radical activating enzyme
MSTPALKLARFHGGPEIFHSLQGEGLSLGLPSIFIRSSLCNLHCRWCDTDYTWNWENTPWPHDRDTEPGYRKFRRDDHIVEMSASEVAAQIQAFPCKNVILTGGEPLLQQPAWLALMQHLIKQDSDYRFEVETNGTLTPDPDFDAQVSQYNVSPKLQNSGNETAQRIRPETLSFFATSTKAWFKFVIAEPSDLAEVKALIVAHHLPQHRILLMPEGRDDTTLQQRRLWLADICRDQGFRYADRLHIQLWGSKRGV